MSETTRSDSSERAGHDALVVGGGVAGLTAAVYLARADLDVLVVSEERSLLERNAHLENVPGFPAGVNARLFVDLLESQAGRAGAVFAEDRVTGVERAADGDARGFVVTGEGGEYHATRVVAASWSDCSYLDGLGVEREQRGSKRFVEVDDGGRTGVDGVYAAGRIAGTLHQAVVAAGHAAEVAIALLHDADVPFYHDWVVPDGYFTGRDRDVPPGCEEIDAEEFRRRERRARRVMQDAFEEPHPETPVQHPSVDENSE
jgi:thioredoxin reductase